MADHHHGRVVIGGERVQHLRTSAFTPVVDDDARQAGGAHAAQHPADSAFVVVDGNEPHRTEHRAVSR
jgi:hypothetical protein